MFCSHRFIQHPKNFGLIASFLERKTVAECVLFYYLTKKNENYKNIVRRNYRRRGRSQVFYSCKLIVQKYALCCIKAQSYNNLCRPEHLEGHQSIFFEEELHRQKHWKSPFAIDMQPRIQLLSVTHLTYLMTVTNSITV